MKWTVTPFLSLQIYNQEVTIMVVVKLSDSAAGPVNSLLDGPQLAFLCWWTRFEQCRKLFLKHFQFNCKQLRPSLRIIYQFPFVNNININGAC